MRFLYRIVEGEVKMPDDQKYVMAYARTDNNTKLGSARRMCGTFRQTAGSFSGWFSCTTGCSWIRITCMTSCRTQ